MSYELKQPYTEEQRKDFICEFSHRQGLQIAQTDEAIYALEPWETLENGVVVENKEAWEAEKIEARKQQFNKDFFLTSLGYIRRKVSMATGEVKDFLSDLLPTISMGVQMGQPVQIITYKEPDFTTDTIDWISLQEVKTVTAEFVQECFLQLSNDFKPVVNEPVEDNLEGTEN